MRFFSIQYEMTWMFKNDENILLPNNKPHAGQSKKFLSKDHG